jgi:hypothetical protein
MFEFFRPSQVEFDKKMVGDSRFWKGLEPLSSLLRLASSASRRRERRKGQALQGPYTLFRSIGSFVGMPS